MQHPWVTTDLPLSYLLKAFGPNYLLCFNCRYIQPNVVNVHRLFKIRLLQKYTYGTTSFKLGFYHLTDACVLAESS